MIRATGRSRGLHRDRATAAWTTVASADHVSRLRLPEFCLIDASSVPSADVGTTADEFVPAGQVAVDTPVMLPRTPLVDVTWPDATVQGVPPPVGQEVCTAGTGPLAPVAPVAPATPAGPCGPSLPGKPCRPAGPVAPVACGTAAPATGGPVDRPGRLPATPRRRPGPGYRPRRSGPVGPWHPPSRPAGRTGRTGRTGWARPDLWSRCPTCSDPVHTVGGLPIVLQVSTARLTPNTTASPGSTAGGP